jgi:hypothetical protein
MGQQENSKVSSNKCVTIMASKSDQQQVTDINPKANAIIERLHKVVNDMLISFDLEKNIINNNKNLVHLITSFNQLHGYLAIRSTYCTTL